MNAGLELLAFRANGVPSSPDRQIEEIRHGAWLFELERALLAMKTERDDASRQERPAAADGHPAGHSGTSGPVWTGADTGRKSGPANSYTVPAGDTDVESRAGHKQFLPVQDVVNPASGNVLPWSGQPAGITMQMLSGTGGGLRHVGQFSPPSDPDFTSQAPLQLRSRGESPLGWQAMHVAEGKQAEADPPACSGQLPPEKGGSEAMHDAEALARRQLHFYRDEDGVHAWIRDAALADYQVYAIARALSGELNASGLKLAALTLNGKKIENLSTGEQETGAGFMADGVRDALPQPSFADKTQR